MDILSAVSSVITLLGAGGTIVQGLERLSSLREAPNTVLSLNNEVSDFRVAILELLSLLQQDSVRSSISPAYNNNLDSVVRRARDKLVELECLIEYRLLAPTSGTEIRLNKTAWILERYKVKRIQEDIRSIRINLITMLGILNGNSISRLQVQLTDMCLVGTRVQDHLTQALSWTDINFHLIEPLLSQMHSHVESHSRSRLQVPVIQHQEPTEFSQVTVSSDSQLQASKPSDDGANSSSSAIRATPTLLITSSIHRRDQACTSTCICRCHQARRWKSPQWLKSLLGLLFTGYIGLPFLNPSCDTRSCQYQSVSMVTLQYYFPPWFASQVLQVSIQLSKHNGIAQSLHTYNVVWNGAQLFRQVRVGDLEGVKTTLSSRQGSPFDVNELGLTALSVSGTA